MALGRAAIRHQRSERDFLPGAWQETRLRAKFLRPQDLPILLEVELSVLVPWRNCVFVQMKASAMLLGLGVVSLFGEAEYLRTTATN
jgi:hypothetical protein